eukprot:COSAG02_NODE_3576_length_6538_cov_3.358907_8_plen_271_part_00
MSCIIGNGIIAISVELRLLDMLHVLPTVRVGVILVTGASSGVGEVIARDFASRGWVVAAVARRKALLEALAADPLTNGNVHPFPCNVADAAAVQDCVAAVEAQCGAIDVVVLNAAVGHPDTPFWQNSIDDIDNVIDINLKGVMYVAHAALQGMVARDAGHIFGIASVAGTHGIANQSIYCTSKHGMLGFMDTLADELNPTSIVCSTICPGGIDTPWWGADRQGAKGTYDGAACVPLHKLRTLANLKMLIVVSTQAPMRVAIPMQAAPLTS